MRARFLLGPAGSGKTFRCLAEIRAELARGPEGPPLLLLAPKQATAQLERQLLADGSLNGYTRLQILSFDRLAQFLLEEFSPAAPNWLDDEGRVMVLRALLGQKKSEMKVFHATARLPGFATRLSRLLRELQRSQTTPKRLAGLAEKITAPQLLRDKLHDLALLLSSYRGWLTAQQLQDADGVLDAATALLGSFSQLSARDAQLRFGGLWLDGFAEMTAQELDLLAALAPLCERSTLAFCLDGEPQTEPSWRSTWAVIGQTYLRCRQRLANLPGAKVSVETIARDPQATRFHSAQLAHLEKSWAHPGEQSAASSQQPESAVRLYSCATPEAEAVLAAREILKVVHAGGRFRDCAVLVRALDSHADTLRRVFDRYEIPCFLDRREPVAHHPLAELTRSALRTIAYGWRQADWFGALKTGLTPAGEDEIDRLENAALEFGWDGAAWRQPLVLPEKPAIAEAAERLRQKLIPPFTALAQAAAEPLTGVQLAAALRELWNDLAVEKKLERWSEASIESAIRNPQPAIHRTVWDQLQMWLDNLERAFPAEALPIREWLPILEAGLATLTAGVIPPALDQVLIGAIDRSRNPELKLACVLGLNEGVFPAPPTEDPLLNERERDALRLADTNIRLGPTARHRLGHEWFYGYIACTRASQRLALTWAAADARGNPLNRSAFVDHLEKLFPGLKPEEWQPPTGFGEIVHAGEIITPAIRLQFASGAPAAAPATNDPSTRELLARPELQTILTRARELAAAENDQLSPATAEHLYGRELPTSISGLEDFAACPFKFFIGRGLRAEERKRFELDARERGSFQHEVLTLFHNELAAEKLRWRDVPPADARARVRRIGKELLASYRRGLFTADAARQFSGETLLGALETLIDVLVGWARDYEFDPAVVETGFGLKDAPWPALRVDVAGGRALLLRGRIDRVDVWRDDASGAALAVVVDYKSSSRKPDRLKLHHGLQLQLPTYLAALERLPEARATLGASALTPAGVFYVNLRGEFPSAKSRAEALADPATALREGFRHAGRYDEQFLARLDPRGNGEQFKTHRAAHDRMDSAAFRDLLDRAVENLRRCGGEIFSGTIAPAPFRKGGETACDHCAYAGVCRFDAWTQPFRTLAEPPAPAAPAAKPKRGGKKA